MLFRNSYLAVFLTTIAAVANAQSRVTSNAFVTATVDPLTGHVTVTQSGAAPQIFLTYPGQSYLSLKINDNYYTNNDAGPNEVSDPIGNGSISNTAIELTGATTTMIADTIETVFTDSAFDIIQDVYPVQFRASGQIVIRVHVTNHSSAALDAQAQYENNLLLHFNGAPFMFDRYNYDATKWRPYLNPATIPSLYLGMEKNPAMLDPGVMGAGFVDDSFTQLPLGLMMPNAIVIGDWNTLVNYTFGGPTSGGTIQDMAVLMQWPTQSIVPNGEVELMRTSYGTAEPTNCFGDAVVFNFFPTHLTFNTRTSRYFNNPFTVLSLVFNPQNSGLTSVSANQTLTNNLRASADTTIQIGSIASNAAFGFTWSDQLPPVYHCTGIGRTDTIAFSMGATGLQPPGFGSGCDFTIQVDCGVLPQAAPFASVTSHTGSFDGSECNARQFGITTFDTGTNRQRIHSLAVDAANNMTVQLPPLSMMGADTLSFSATVIDSMKDGFAVVEIADTLGTTTIDSIRYCTIPDMHGPSIVGTPNVDTITVQVLEDHPWDRGLKIITVDASNFAIDTLPTTATTQGKFLVLFHAVTDASGGRLHVHAIDLAGNASDTTWTLGTSDVQQARTISGIRIYPNPTTDQFTIELPPEMTHVELLDVLGRTVARFDAEGTYAFDATGLAVGTYMLRLTNGEVVRFMKQ